MRWEFLRRNQRLPRSNRDGVTCQWSFGCEAASLAVGGFDHGSTPMRSEPRTATIHEGADACRRLRAPTHLGADAERPRSERRVVKASIGKNCTHAALRNPARPRASTSPWHELR